MKNKFAHEISITKHFMSELESYLERDEAKQLEEMMERYYTLKQETDKQIKELNEELSETRLKVSKMGMERGKLLKEIDILRQYMNNDNEAMANEKIAEPDATGRP